MACRAEWEIVYGENRSVAHYTVPCGSNERRQVLKRFRRKHPRARIMSMRRSRAWAGSGGITTRVNYGQSGMNIKLWGLK